MALSDHERKSKLEKVKESLYDKYADIRPRQRSTLHTHTAQGAHDWDDADIEQKVHYSKDTMSKSKKTLHWIKKFFIVSLGFFLLAALFAAFKLFDGGNNVSTDGIDLSIMTQPFVDGGEDLPITVQITNNNPTNIETADIIFEYPVTSLPGSEQTRQRVSIDTVRAGDTVFEDFDIQLFGEEGEERLLTAKLEYRVAGSNAIFVKEATELVTIRSTPIELLIEGRDSTIPNEMYAFDILVSSNATDVAGGIILKVEYPQGFTFETAEPAPTFDVDTWVIGDLEPASDRTIHIEGKLEGATTDNKVFRVLVGQQDERQERKIGTVFNSKVHPVRLTPSFIDASLAANGVSGTRIIIPAAQKTSVTVNWKNTLPIQLQNVKLEAIISGNAYSSAGIDGTDGFFDSNTNSIVWDPTVFDSLISVDPGEQGTFKFNVKPQPLASTNGQIISQPLIHVVVRASGIDSVGQIQDAETVASVDLVINSDVRLEPKTLHYGGPFTNAGSVPPTVETETEYTLVWHLTNSSTNVTGAKLTTRLPAYVDWQGATFPTSEDLTYNTVTRELVWDVGQLEAGAGFTTDPREVSFKVAITPSTSQRGDIPPLTESLVFEGNDTYTNGTIRIVRNPHTTKLLNDVSMNNGVVE